MMWALHDAEPIFYEIEYNKIKALCQILGRLIDLSLSFYIKTNIYTYFSLYT